MGETRGKAPYDTRTPKRVQLHIKRVNSQLVL